MLFTCLPEGARIPGRFPGPAHARGKWFTVDIHCHVTSVKAAAMVEGNEAVSRWCLETQANARSREINRQNGVRTRVQGTSAEQRIADPGRQRGATAGDPSARGKRLTRRKSEGPPCRRAPAGRTGLCPVRRVF